MKTSSGTSRPMAWNVSENPMIGRNELQEDLFVATEEDVRGATQFCQSSSICSATRVAKLRRLANHEPNVQSFTRGTKIFITWCIVFPLGNRNFIINKMTRAAQKNILQSFIIFILIESFRFTS